MAWQSLSALQFILGRAVLCLEMSIFQKRARTSQMKLWWDLNKSWKELSIIFLTLSSIILWPVIHQFIKFEFECFFFLNICWTIRSPPLSLAPISRYSNPTRTFFFLFLVQLKIISSYFFWHSIICIHGIVVFFVVSLIVLLPCFALWRLHGDWHFACRFLRCYYILLQKPTL